MKKFTLFLLLISFLKAQVYYLDASDGNDFNLGTSPKKAWKSIKKLNGFKFMPGDKIAFKRGEKFVGYFSVSSSGKEGKPIVFTSYGKGAKPIITSMMMPKAFKIESNWKRSAKKDIWYFNMNFNPQRVRIEGKEVLRAGNSFTQIDGVKTKWFWERGKFYIYAKENPSLYYNLIEINIPYQTILVKNRHHIIFEDLDIRGGSGYAMAIRGSYNIVVRNCNIGAYSRMGLQVMDNFEEGRYIPSKNILVENSLFDSKYHFKYSKAPSDRGCIDGLLINNGVQNSIFRKNIFKDWGHTAINLVALNKLNPGVYNNKIYNNIITAKNVPYGRGIGVEGIESKTHHNEFFYNIIKNTTVRSQFNGDHNSFHHNIIDTVKNSDIKPYGTAQGIEIQGYGKCVCHDNSIENNVIVNCDEAGIRLREDRNEKFNNKVINNIIYNCGLNSKDGYKDIALVIDNGKSIKTNIYKNNCIFNPNSKSKKIVFYRGKFLDIKTFNKQKKDLIDKNIQKDPKFVNFKKRDFHLLPSSPCIDAGANTSKTRSFKGKAPDIGLYEER